MASESVFDAVASNTDRDADASVAVAERLTGINPTAPLETSDYTGPMSALARGGVTIAPFSDAVLIPASPGRVKFYISNLGDGRVWLGFDQPGAPNLGIVIGKSGYLSEFLAGEVHAYNNSSAPVLVTYQELAG